MHTEINNLKFTSSRCCDKIVAFILLSSASCFQASQANLAWAILSSQVTIAARLGLAMSSAFFAW